MSSTVSYENEMLKLYVEMKLILFPYLKKKIKKYLGVRLKLQTNVC